LDLAKIRNIVRFFTIHQT